MTTQLPPVYFYLPQPAWPPTDIPSSMDNYWEWQRTQALHFKGGKYHWTLQTYLYLKADGFPCELVGTVPSEGIVVTHRDFLPAHQPLGLNLLLVCIQADRPVHPYAQLHIVQNPEDEKLKQPSSLWESYFIPYWPQPSLIPRDPARGDRFENIAYFGSGANLATELCDRAWREQLQAIGLTWIFKGRDDENGWNDYSDVDAIVAVRSFDYQGQYIWKPASKLINAWHAGVPAILGCESAYRAQRQSDLDFLEVASLNEVILALKRLRDDKALRQAMVDNGRSRAKATQPARIAAEWRHFLTGLAVTTYNAWCNKSNLGKQLFWQQRRLSIRMHNVQQRIQTILTQTLPEPTNQKSENWN